MADVSIDDDHLQIELTVPERVLSLHGASVVVPREHVRGVRIVRDILAQIRGMRMPGAGIPGVLALGTWRGDEDGRPFHDFVLVHRPGPGVVVTTEGTYDRLLLGDVDPESFAAALGFA